MEREDKDIEPILTKWLTGTATQEELAFLKAWSARNDQNFKIKETLQKAWEEKTAEPLLVNVDEKINDIWLKGMKHEDAKPSFWNSLLKYAAVIFLLAGVTFVIFMNYTTNPPKVQLTAEPTIIIRENPAGQKTKFFLPDGSTAYLNSASQIKYEAGFQGSERRLYLEGEAYFEVAKDNNKPFIVSAKGMETLALGTEFNVNAYQETDRVSVSLVAGKVLVQQAGTSDLTVTLLPGKELVVNPVTLEATEKVFNQDHVTGWKDGNLYFQKAAFNEVKSKIERWFGIEVQVIGQVPQDWKVSTVYKGQTLRNILTDLSYSKNFAYEIMDEKVIISFK